MRAVGSKGSKSLDGEGRFEAGGMQHPSEVDFLVSACICNGRSLELDFLWMTC